MKIFIGYDDRERVAYHVLSHSILRRATVPVEIAPLNRNTLRGIYDRPRGEHESTDFSLSRFIVPYLCDYQGWAIFMDCDMVCRGDIADLARWMTMRTRWTSSVHLVKHAYDPDPEDKFLGQKQTVYEQKNWSSVMLFNNHLCRNLTPEFVNTAPGLALHQFKWTERDKIGDLPKAWNYLVGEKNQCLPDEAKLIHFTRGSPCFAEFANCEFADLWRAELKDMLGHA